MKIYISGKITGEPRPSYHHKFSVAEDKLKVRGHQVINPVRMNEPINMQGFTHDDNMHLCFAYIDVCDAVYMMEGWENSPGARAEHEYAINSAKQLIYESVERGRKGD